MKKLETIKLKNSAEYNEAWLQKQIAENPSILGLGELHLRAKEKILTYGRLDILLEDSDSDNPTRYEVEIQLAFNVISIKVSLIYPLSILIFP